MKHIKINPLEDLLLIKILKTETSDIIKIMKRLICKFIFIIFVYFLAVPTAQAIKIGLQTDVPTVHTGVSSKGMITDKLTGNVICSLDAMKTYVLKATKNDIEIKIEGKYYNLGSKFIVIQPVDTGFVCAKNKWYRGSIVIANRGGSLTVVNDVKLEDYLLGVVPCEMPSSWHEEALKAQAIAARSYAVANLGKNGSKGFDLRDTTDDQVYGGALSETERTNQIVSQTYGIVVTQNKQVITAFYSASAGGKTSNSSNELSYLRSVPSYDDEVKKMGHGMGMSQYGANNLAKKGYNAYQILTYYYNNIKFGKLSDNWNL